MELLELSSYCPTEHTEWQEYDRGSGPLLRMVPTGWSYLTETRCGTVTLPQYFCHVLLILVIIEPYTQALEPH